MNNNQQFPVFDSFLNFVGIQHRLWVFFPFLQYANTEMYLLIREDGNFWNM